MSRNNPHREVVTIRGREIPCEQFKTEGVLPRMRLFDRRPQWQRDLVNEYHEAHVDMAISHVGLDRERITALLIARRGKPIVARRKLRYRSPLASAPS